MAEPDSTEPKPSEPVASIEREPAAENEQVEVAEAKDDGKDGGPAEDKSDNDAEGEDDAQGEENDGRPVSRNQYKALKSITDTLTNHKVKIKDESVAWSVTRQLS